MAGGHNAATPRRLLITITGFTIAHSVTLALSALDLVCIPTPPVEAAIALSVVFLAWEIAKQDKRSLTYRYPIAIASSFGLLHGFGFASVLRDIGLPQVELPTALLFFNVGVEIGQILFVAVLLAVYVALRGLWSVRSPARNGEGGIMAAITLPASYLVGTVACYWTIGRIASFWV